MTPPARVSFFLQSAKCVGCVFSCTNLSVFLVRRGVVCDLKEVQVDHVFHFVVVSPSLTNDDGSIEQEYMPEV